MKKNFCLTALLLAGFVVVLIWVFWPRQQGPSSSRPIAGTPTNPMSSVPNDGSPGTATSQENFQRQSETNHSPSSPFTAADGSNSFEEWVRDVQPPIEFYGKVVDEDDQPVVGATVEFTWTHMYPEADVRTNTLSGADGMFSLTEVNGSGLNVNVSKSGYSAVRSLTLNNFNYVRLPSSQGPFKPDPLNPVIFHLRKQGPGTDLITSQVGAQQKLGVRCPLDGEPIWIDLLGRQSGQRGQLEITQIKPHYSKVKEAREWSFRMSIPSGGFVEQNDEFPFKAPESGYKPIVEFRFVRGETNWTTHLRKQYYIAFGEPRHYGWLILETQIGMEGARLQYAINPHGSRYLEPKQTQPALRQLPPGVREVIPDDER